MTRLTSLPWEAVARRSSWRNWAEFAAAWLVFQALAWAPLALARRLASALAAAAYRLTPRWRRIGLRNLGIAFPDNSAAERERILRGCYQNLGRVLLALARLPRLHPGNVSRWIAYEGFEHYEKALSRGRGVVFLTAHLGCWELSSAAHALLGHPMLVMVRPLDNPLLDRFVDRRRSLFGNRTLQKQHAPREVLRALRANQAVGILADQNAAGDDGVFVDFFGLAASATKGVAQLAARAGAAVIPGFAFWDPAAERYVLKFYAPIEQSETGGREHDVLENTRLFQAAIERAVREHPDQWLWIHRRWKRRPPGEPDLYA